MGYVKSTTVYLIGEQFVKIHNGLRVMRGGIFGDPVAIRFLQFRFFLMDRFTKSPRELNRLIKVYFYVCEP